jgi:hypothetical protein
MFSGGTVDFSHGVFSGGKVDFGHGMFNDGAVNFTGAAFSGGTVSFEGATFSGGTVDLAPPRGWSSPPVGLDRASPIVLMPSPEHLAKIVKARRNPGCDVLE